MNSLAQGAPKTISSVADFYYTCQVRSSAHVARSTPLEKAIPPFPFLCMSASALRLGLAPCSRGRLKINFDTQRVWSYTKSHFSAAVSLDLADHPAAQALARIPYPRIEPDHSIFEDLSDEYSLQGNAVSTSASSSTPVETLVQAVKDKQWEHADALRRELVETGTSIPHHRCFEDAALSALSTHSPELFAAWLELIPDFHAHGKPRQFRFLRARLFADAPANLESIMNFAFITTDKHLGRYVYTQAAANVVRHAPPQVAHEFLFELRRRMLVKAVGKHSQGRARRIKELFSVAVRTHASAGRLDHGVALLQAARKEGISISGFTYTMLLQRLSLAGDGTRFQAVQVLTPAHVLAELSAAYAQTTTESSPPISISSASPAARLRALNHSIKSPSHRRRAPSSSTSLSTHDLSQFIHEYTIHRPPSSPRSLQLNAIELLRRRASRAGARAAATFALAEMLAHHRRHAHREVLSAFMRSFHVVGVPTDTSLHVDAPVESSAKTSLGARGKLWPGRKHTALVWSAMVSLKVAQGSTPEHGQKLVDALYAELLAQAHAPHTASHTVDSAHFTAFLSAFARVRGPPGAARIMSDMHALALAPHAAHWAIVLRALAERGAAEQVWGLLDAMEGPQGANGFPEASIATHTAVLKGFVRAERVAEGHEVARRIGARYGYVRGARARTEEALKGLEALERRLEEERELAEGYLERRAAA
ncbi:hypothetical protein HWV62_21673 [Athelia sp. TMB]|nr:hypothetical protein HWV62_21673 [Athelia sp. TMB]